MQDEIFPDEDDFGRVFRNNAVLSDAGVPQYAAIMGNCVAGGAYLPVLCDKMLMTEGSSLYLAGPSLVKAAIGQVIEEEELGGAQMHATVSGTIDFREVDDEACLARLRTLVEMLPAERYAFDSIAADAIKTESPWENLYQLISPKEKTEYDARDLIACMVDEGSVNEYKAEYGQTLVTTFAKIGGRSVGIVANQGKRVDSQQGGIQIGGVVCADSADKAAKFVTDCNQMGVPIVFLQNVTGFMVGRDAEHSGIIQSGARLVHAVSNSVVPRITVIVGGSFGAGSYALCGKAFDPHFIYAWPGASYAVMGGVQAASTLLALEKRRIEREGGGMSDEELAELQHMIEENYQTQTDIRYGAARGWIDAVIAPETTRSVLIQSLDYATRPHLVKTHAVPRYV